MAHLPVEKIRETLGAVSLVDPLATSLLAEGHHLVGELRDRVLDRLGTTVNDVDSVILRVLDELVHVATAVQREGFSFDNWLWVMERLTRILRGWW